MKKLLYPGLIIISIMGLLMFTMKATYNRGKMDGLKEGTIIFQAILDQEKQKLDEANLDSLAVNQLDSLMLNHSELIDTVPPLLFNVQVYE